MQPHTTPTLATLQRFAVLQIPILFPPNVPVIRANVLRTVFSQSYFVQRLVVAVEKLEATVAEIVDWDVPASLVGVPTT
jgi:hypothetical protein